MSASRTGRAQFRIDVTQEAGLDATAHLFVELLLPDAMPRLLFVCVPGGGMNSRYFDLDTPPGEEEVSFSKAMLAKGHGVLLIDPLGVGNSTVPEDAYLLHPDQMAATHAVALEHVLDGLRSGTLVEGLPPAPDLRSVGIGHSMGALLTVVQQAAQPVHDGLALLGFHTAGLPDQLTQADLDLDRAEARARLAELARMRFPVGFLPPNPSPSSRPLSTNAALDRINLAPSYMTMLPDMIAADAAGITVPLLLAVGDNDLHSDPHQMPTSYPGSKDISLLVLEDTRHNHFIFPSRTRLFERVARWAEAL